MYRYWGKASKTDASFHLLVYHCLDVGAVLRCLLDADSFVRGRLAALTPALAPSDLEALLLSFAVLHDMGKFAPAFQNMRPDLVTRLDGPAAKGPITNEHHSHLGQLAFFDKTVRPAWPAAFQAMDPADARDLLSPLAQAAFGHHGRPPKELPGTNLRFPEATSHAVRQFMGEVIRLTLPEEGLVLPESDDAEDTFKRVSWLFAGLLVLADWLASGERFAYESGIMPLDAYWTGQALPQARAAVAASGILCPPPRLQGDFHTLLPHLPDTARPTPLQALAMEPIAESSGPHLFIFEDATGAGKTEAALLAAHACMAAGLAEGFSVGLPTMATANSLYARLATAYRGLFQETDCDGPSLMLAHGARGIHDAFLRSIGLEQGRPSEADSDDRGRDNRESGAFCAGWLADNRKKALLASCGVGTLDQALLGVLPAKHQCLRLLGLGRNVLIADEVHAYDRYTTRLLEQLLTFQAGLGGSAILLSATLPRRIKQGLATAFCRGAGYPLPELTDRPLPLATRISAQAVRETELPATDSRTVAVTLTDDIETAFDRLVAVHNAGGCAICIRNTVDRAVEAHSRLATRVPPEDLLLFHARFALCDRLAIEERVLAIFGKDSTPEDRRGKILVASQVVEQSLDIDADFLVTELAPMELMLQRIGREHRHRRSWRPEGFTAPEVLVIAPRSDDDADSGWGEAVLGRGLFVYPAKGLLWRTARLLELHPRLDLPRQAREMVEAAYDEDTVATPEALQKADAVQDNRHVAEQSLARANSLDFSQGYSAAGGHGAWYDDRITPTRLGEETAVLRLVKVVGDGLELWAGPGRDAKTCSRSEVSVAYHRVAGLAPAGVWKDRLEAFAASLPDKGRWVTLVPLVETAPPGQWQCALPGWEHISYSLDRGFEFLDKDK